VGTRLERNNPQIDVGQFRHFNQQAKLGAHASYSDDLLPESRLTDYRIQVRRVVAVENVLPSDSDFNRALDFVGFPGDQSACMITSDLQDGLTGDLGT
jgi:hypothetical protein